MSKRSRLEPVEAKSSRAFLVESTRAIQDHVALFLDPLTLWELRHTCQDLHSVVDGVMPEVVFRMLTKSLVAYSQVKAHQFGNCDCFGCLLLGGCVRLPSSCRQPLKVLLGCSVWTLRLVSGSPSLAHGYNLFREVSCYADSKQVAEDLAHDAAQLLPWIRDTSTISADEVLVLVKSPSRRLTIVNWNLACVFNLLNLPYGKRFPRYEEDSEQVKRHVLWRVANGVVQPYFG